MPINPNYIPRSQSQRLSAIAGDLQRQVHGINRRGSSAPKEIHNLSSATETVFQLVHNLATYHVRVEVYDNNGDRETITPLAVKRLQTNLVEIELDATPGEFDGEDGGAIAILS